MAPKAPPLASGRRASKLYMRVHSSTQLADNSRARPSQKVPRRFNQGWRSGEVSATDAASVPWRSQAARPDNQARRPMATTHHTENPNR